MFPRSCVTDLIKAGFCRKSLRVRFIRIKTFIISVSQIRPLLLKLMYSVDNGCMWKWPGHLGSIPLSSHFQNTASQKDCPWTEGWRRLPQSLSPITCSYRHCIMKLSIKLIWWKQISACFGIGLGFFWLDGLGICCVPKPPYSDGLKLSFSSQIFVVHLHPLLMPTLS